MKPEKKIELQAKMIQDLKSQVTQLTSENSELLQKIQETETLLAEAETYKQIHTQCIETLTQAKDKYYAALMELQKERKAYQKEMKGFFKGLRKVGLKNSE